MAWADPLPGMASTRMARSSSVSRPRIATIDEPCGRSSPGEVTAAARSSTRVAFTSVSASISCWARTELSASGPTLGPSASASSSVMPVASSAIPADATAETAHSKEPWEPVPACAERRLSSTKRVVGCQDCSSRRTISSPTRAVERQCTRRTSSPRRYSRTSTSSCPTRPARALWVSAEAPEAPARSRPNSCTCGVTATSVVLAKAMSLWDSPNGSKLRTNSGPIRKRPRSDPTRR